MAPGLVHRIVARSWRIVFYNSSNTELQNLTTGDDTWLLRFIDNRS